MNNGNYRLKNFIEKIKTTGKLRFFLIIFCCTALMLIIGISLFSDKAAKISANDSVSDYVYGLERKMENALCKVAGAGKVTVAISVESGMETVLAMTTTVKEGVNGKETVSSPLTVNGKTVVLKELYPKINGVLIVAEGAGSLNVYNKIQQATLSLLDVKISQIEILAMK